MDILELPFLFLSCPLRDRFLVVDHELLQHHSFVASVHTFIRRLHSSFLIYFVTHFAINLTPFSIGISEALTYFGTRDTNLGIIEIIFLINTFRIGIMLVSLVFSPFYFLNQFYRKK